MGTFDYAAKIQRLIANAENEALSDEARAAYRAKAEQFMRQYRIAEEEALATDPGSAKPITHKITLRQAGLGQSDLQSWYASVFASIASHTGVRHVTRYELVPDKGYAMVATVVGYEGDVRYTEFLWTAAYLMFSTRIDPVWDSTLDEATNIYRLRAAGHERRKIADQAWGNGNLPAARSKVQRIYVRECRRRGEVPGATGLGYQTDAYRQSYARSFRETLHSRLAEARNAADSIGGVLVLHGRSDRVNEAFYELFPEYRPSNTPTPDREPCPKCAKAKSGYCRDHNAVRWTATDQRRWERMTNSTSARAGAISGRAAAEGVTIERGHTRATRLDASGTAIEG
jgi:hypothetical protein